MVGCDSLKVVTGVRIPVPQQSAQEIPVKGISCFAVARGTGIRKAEQVESADETASWGRENSRVTTSKLLVTEPCPAVNNF